MAQEYLSEAGWKSAARRFEVEDNGLQRALWSYERLDPEKYKERLEAIDRVAALAGDLRRKEGRASSDAAKYLAKVANAAEFERREILGAQEVAAKAAEEARKRELMARQEEELDEEEEENPEAEEDYHRIAKLLGAGIKRLRGSQGESFDWTCTRNDATNRTPAAGLMVAESIGAAHRKLLTKFTGSKHFMSGTCRIEAGKFTFITDGSSPQATFVSQMRRSIQYFTGKTFPVRAHGSEDSTVVEEGSEDEEELRDLDEPEEPDDVPDFVPGVEVPEEEEEEEDTPLDMIAPLSLGASVGKDGRNEFEDVQAVQAALNRKAKAGLDVDGLCGPLTIAAINAFQRSIGFTEPDGLIEPGKTTERALQGQPKKPEKPEKPKAPKREVPKKDALAYEPGEVEESLRSPGRVEKTASGFVLFNFGADKFFIKPEHQRFLAELVKKLDLENPAAERSITVISGFTDGVDVESRNSTLREARADAVQIFLMGKGAAEENVGALAKTGPGQFLAPNTTREGRSRNRAVTIALGSMIIPPIPDPPKPKPAAAKSTKWALQSNLSASIPTKPGVAISTVNFILHDRENHKKFLLQFAGFGGGFGLSFPASVALPSPTDFETESPVDVEAFNGGGAIVQGSVGLGIGFSEGRATLHPRTKPAEIDISGFQFSFGVEASFVGGHWKVLG